MFFFLHFVIVTLNITEKYLKVSGLCKKAGEVLIL